MTNALTSRLKKKKKGFTLIELIIVIAIIAILAAIAIPKFGAVKKDANVKADIANAQTIEKAVATLIAQDNIKLPTTDSKTITLSGTAPAGTGTATDDYNALNGYLQTRPTPKATTGDFVVTVTSNGSISVEVLDGSKHTHIYPNGDGDVYPATP